MDNYETKDEFMAWCKSKLEEYKGDDIRDKLCGLAIMENNGAYLSKLLELRYPRGSDDISICIVEDYGSCLGVLINHFDFSMDKLKLLTNSALNKASFSCVRHLNEKIWKCTHSKYVGFPGIIGTSDAEFNAWGKSLASPECKDNLKFSERACYQAILVKNSRYLSLLAKLGYVIYVKDVNLCITNEQSKCLKVCVEHLNLGKIKCTEYLTIAQAKVSLNCAKVLVDHMTPKRRGLY